MKKLSKRGARLIKGFEGLELDAYRDSAGVLTIGYGHTGTVTEGQRISRAQADALFNADVASFEAAVNRLATSEINQSQFDALVSFAFNLGAGALQRSTLLRKVNANPKDPSIREEFAKWINITVGGQLEPLKGLIRRRAAEADLYFEDRQKKNTADPGHCCPHCGGELLVGISAG